MSRRAPLAVLLASPEDIETQFYEALQAGDLERLVALWVGDEEVRCIHPGGPLLVGITAIRATFEQLLARGGLPIEPTDVRKLQTDQLAVHQVRERRLEPGPEGMVVSWVVASNVYLKTAQGWRMVLHHASPAQSGGASPLATAASAVLH